MKKWILCLIAFLSISFNATASHSLVFVHLGSNIPSCIFTVIKQARTLNPDCELYLLTDSAGYPIFLQSNEEFLRQEHVLLIDGDKLPITEQHKQLRNLIQVDHSAADSYLFYTLERFFYLLDLIEHYKLQNVVHLENDTMLYMDLNELLPFFYNAKVEIGVPFLSNVAAVPCFVFIKNRSSFLSYIEHVLIKAKKYQGPKSYVGVSDMKTLASFYKEFEDSYLTPLPTLMPEYERFHRKRKSRYTPDNATSLDFLSRAAPLFSGILFDAATLGIFANGNDRKHAAQNGPGTIHFRSLFDPRPFSFYWGKDSQKRDVPYLSFKGQDYRIVNMHIHSKKPEGFTSFGKTRSDFP